MVKFFKIKPDNFSGKGIKQFFGGKFLSPRETDLVGKPPVFSKIFYHGAIQCFFFKKVYTPGGQTRFSQGWEGKELGIV